MSGPSKPRPTMSELHSNISPIDVSMIRSNQPIPPPPTQAPPPPPLTEAERQWRHQQNAGPEVHPRVRVPHVENKDEEKHRKISEILEISEFFWAGHHDMIDLAHRKRIAGRRLKKMIMTFVNYMEHEYKKTKMIPVFPKIFHRTISDVYLEIFCQLRLNTDTVKVYTAVQSCVNILDGFTNLPFFHYACRMDDDDPVWKMPYSEAEEPLKKLSTDRFVDVE